MKLALSLDIVLVLRGINRNMTSLLEYFYNFFSAVANAWFVSMGSTKTNG